MCAPSEDGGCDSTTVGSGGCESATIGSGGCESATVGSGGCDSTTVGSGVEGGSAGVFGVASSVIGLA